MRYYGIPKDTWLCFWKMLYAGGAISGYELAQRVRSLREARINGDEGLLR